MTSGTFVLLSGALTFGVPIYLAMRDLRNMGPRGHGGGRGPDANDPAPEPPAPDNPVIAPVQKPLPDCLIPRPLVHVPQPADRELEPA